MPPETSLPPPEPEREPRWRREYNRYAIGIVILLHLANNDGIHAASPEMAKVKLVQLPSGYFQGPGFGLALILGWRKPGTADFDYLPRKLIGRPPALAPIQAKE